MSHTLNWLALVLVIVGGLNWGLIGLFEFNLVDALFGGAPWLVRAIYTIVGLAAGYMVYYAATVEAKASTRDARAAH